MTCQARVRGAGRRERRESTVFEKRHSGRPAQDLSAYPRDLPFPGTGDFHPGARGEPRERTGAYPEGSDLHPFPHTKTPHDAPPDGTGRAEYGVRRPGGDAFAERRRKFVRGLVKRRAVRWDRARRSLGACCPHQLVKEALHLEVVTDANLIVVSGYGILSD